MWLHECVCLWSLDGWKGVLLTCRPVRCCRCVVGTQIQNHEEQAKRKDEEMMGLSMALSHAEQASHTKTYL